MKHDVCKLCLNDKELMRSHVLPEFFYEPTYDEKHRFISVSSHPKQNTRPFEKGLREYLLCKECEGQLSRYESYGASVLRKADEYRRPGNRVIEIPDFNYTYFKLFGLSLIWRCHASRLHMFGAVKLGPHAETIRAMLASENPGKPSDYCFALIKIEGSGHTDRIIIAPGMTRFQGHNAYIFMAYGFEWVFIISSHSNRLSEDLPFVGMKQDLIVLIQEWNRQEFLQEMRRRMSKLIEKDKSTNKDEKKAILPFT